jgi:hypothetical protein
LVYDSCEGELISMILILGCFGCFSLIAWAMTSIRGWKISRPYPRNMDIGSKQGISQNNVIPMNLAGRNFQCAKALSHGDARKGPWMTGALLNDLSVIVRPWQRPALLNPSTRSALRSLRNR